MNLDQHSVSKLIIFHYVQLGLIVKWKIEFNHYIKHEFKGDFAHIS